MLRRKPEVFAERLMALPSRQSHAEAVAALIKEGQDTRALVAAILQHLARQPDRVKAYEVFDFVRVALAWWELHEQSLEELEFIARANPVVALKVLSEQKCKGGFTEQALPLVVRLATQRGPAQAPALELMTYGKHAVAQHAEALRAVLRDGEAAAVHPLVHELFARHGVDLEGLADPRAEVRRAAWSGWLRAPRSEEDVPRLLQGLADSTDSIRRDAHGALLEWLQGAQCRGATIAVLARSAEQHPKGLSALLAEACLFNAALKAGLLAALPATHPLHRTLSSPHSLACARCHWVGAGQRWGRDAPKALSSLELVAGLESTDSDASALWRCPDCMAHFGMGTHTETDVNSQHHEGWLTRLTLKTVKAHYLRHVDLAHPRLATWERSPQI